MVRADGVAKAAALPFATIGRCEWPQLAVVVLLAHTAADAQEPVRFLQDRDCGSTTVLIGLLQDVAVNARCETVGSDRVMHVSVQNHSTKYLKLKLFTIGFCDQPVLTVGSPDGWQGQIANDVEWSIRPNDFGTLSQQERDEMVSRLF
jgi:hypothetical protein